MHDRDRSTNQTLRRGLLLLIAFATQSGLMGCQHLHRQTMTGLWGAVPQVRWSAFKDNPDPPAQSEPSVSANSGASLTPTSPDSQVSSQAISTGNQRPTSTNVPTYSQSSSNSIELIGESRLEASDGLNELQPLTAPTPQGIFTDTSTDQIERLKAALNDDAERAKSPSHNGFGSHEVRIRVEAMLEKARRLFDLGQLREARHTARIAQEIGDSARLDYSPEEERPADLVQRIEDQLNEQESQSSNASAQSTESKPDSSLTPGTAPSLKERAAKDLDGTSKSRRDWSGYGLAVFRRERKPAPVEPVIPTTAGPESRGGAEATGGVQLGLETDSESAEESPGAVVQANRSLQLVKGPALTPGGAEFDAGEMSGAANESGTFESVSAGDTPLTPAGSMSELENPRSEVNLNSTAWTGDTSNSLPRKLQEDSGPPPTDFEDIKPISPFQEIATPLIDEPEPAQVEQPRPVNWTVPVSIFAAAFSVLTAVFWYRRGAT